MRQEGGGEGVPARPNAQSPESGCWGTPRPSRLTSSIQHVVRSRRRCTDGPRGHAGDCGLHPAPGSALPRALTQHDAPFCHRGCCEGAKPVSPCSPSEPGPSAGRTRPWPALPPGAPQTQLPSPSFSRPRRFRLRTGSCWLLSARRCLLPRSSPPCQPPMPPPPSALSQTLLQQPVSGTLGTGAAAPGAAAGSWGRRCS